MDIIIPSDLPLDKAHYTYVLKYPENYPEPDKAGTVFYVGKGKGYRLSFHEWEARSGKTRNPYKIRIIQKIWDAGCEVDKTILARFTTHEEACMHEIALIFFLPNLTNLTRGGEGVVGMIRTAEHQSKIADAHRGQHPSLKTRHKMGIAQRNSLLAREKLLRINEAKRGKPSWNKGIPNSEKTREKLRAVRKNQVMKPHTEETKRKISEGNKGRKRTEEWNRKNSEANKGRKLTKPRSEEYRHKLSEANKGKGKGQKQPPEIVAKRAASNTGKKRTPEQRARISEGIRKRALTAKKDA